MTAHGELGMGQDCEFSIMWVLFVEEVQSIYVGLPPVDCHRHAAGLSLETPLERACCL